MRPPEAVRNFLKQENIFRQSITCALSGGADSVCLLVCLLECRKAFQLDISAIHVQHHLRGEESLQDENFCKTLCENVQIPLKIISVDVSAYRKQYGGSLETAARECRYRAFSENVSGLVATAHTASDQLETVLFRLARGTGLKGLCGIPARRGNYIRPLLAVTRQEIEQYLNQKNLSFVTDSSNLSDDYSRNFIRHHIIPEMQQVHAQPEQAVFRMTGILAEEENFLETYAEQAFSQCLQPDGTLKNLHLLHPALQKRCLQIFLKQHQLPANYAQILLIQQLLEKGGTAELIPHKLSVHVSQHVLFLEKLSPPPPDKLLSLGENYLFPEYSLIAERIPKNSPDFEKIHKLFANSALDYDIIKKPAILHARKPGLSFRPSGKTHSVSVKKWLQTQPLPFRNVLHYLSDENGLLWVQNLGVAEHVSVTEKTENMLILHVHRNDTELP